MLEIIGKLHSEWWKTEVLVVNVEKRCSPSLSQLEIYYELDDCEHALLHKLYENFSVVILKSRQTIIFANRNQTKLYFLIKRYIINALSNLCKLEISFGS